MNVKKYINDNKPNQIRHDYCYISSWKKLFSNNVYTTLVEFKVLYNKIEQSKDHIKFFCLKETGLS